MMQKPATAARASSTLQNLFEQHLENPFLVLALPPTASAAQIERQGQKWLSMLAAGLGEAGRYDTPMGPRARTAEKVRVAVAALADPARRLGHEFWAAGWTAP